MGSDSHCKPFFCCVGSGTWPRRPRWARRARWTWRASRLYGAYGQDGRRYVRQSWRYAWSKEEVGRSSRGTDGEDGRHHEVRQAAGSSDWEGDASRVRREAPEDLEQGSIHQVRGVAAADASPVWTRTPRRSRRPWWPSRWSPSRRSGSLAGPLSAWECIALMSREGGTPSPNFAERTRIG